MKAKWLVGITGGIAAYKAPELLRLLIKQGTKVRVVLSKGAKAFVTPMTLQAISGHPVYSHLLDPDFEAAMGHIELARWADGILIAPLSANRLAALAHGFADDLLTTLCLVSAAPIWVVPAMNAHMWHHPATQANITILKDRGITVLGPDWGEQACGEIGLGRMSEPGDIISQLFPDRLSSEKCLQGLNVLITAGPTQEHIDPFRFLSNRSSGKMGFALASAAVQEGAKVTLVSGPVHLETPYSVERIDVTTAKEMYKIAMEKSETADIFISAAAVTDFYAEDIATQKIKKEKKQKLELELSRSPDILAEIAAKPKRPFCVGFSAETTDRENHAKKKLMEKNLDLIALNDVSREDIGFQADTNELIVFSKNKSYTIHKDNKYRVALKLLQIISECYGTKYKTKNT